MHERRLHQGPHGAQQDGFELHLGAAERGSRAQRQTGPEQADAHGAILKRRESDSGDGRVLFHEKMTVAVRQPWARRPRLSGPRPLLLDSYVPGRPSLAGGPTAAAGAVPF